MYAGKIVEFGRTEDILSRPLMPYTRALIDSTPSIHRDKSEKLMPIESMIPDPFNLPKGCRFAPRCRHSQTRCLIESPRPTQDAINTSHSYSCFYPLKNEWAVSKANETIATSDE
jgi:oligopeptide/dipeptide ABC transporter ATP-binding protein